MITYRVSKHNTSPFNTIRVDIFKEGDLILPIYFSELNNEFVSSYISLGEDILNFILTNNIVLIINKIHKLQLSYTLYTFQLTSKSLLEVL
jgi:hypothetical protein